VTAAGPDLLPPPRRYLETLVETALTEDLGGDPGRDVTTEATVPGGATARVAVRARSQGTVAGGVVWPFLLRSAARRLGRPAPLVDTVVPDGDRVGAGETLAVLSGAAGALLVAERSGLNLVGRACGVATATAAWVAALTDTSTRVLDTRKTPPGLREWDKYAVRCGGGVNKRFGLFDVAMIKDNHVAAAGGVGAAIAAVRAHAPDVTLQVEVDSLDQVSEALHAGARYLMCDNMSADVLATAVVRARSLARRLDGRPGTVEIEATGGLTLSTAPAVAATGVDYVSVGALTHSAPVLDVGLDWD
jgi:nicotinate-nucleotide pyrophosphorylase (carboxylating)